MGFNACELIWKVEENPTVFILSKDSIALMLAALRNSFHFGPSL